MTPRLLILLVALAAWVNRASAQRQGQASHTVTVERTAETRVTGPERIPLSTRNLLGETSPLEVSSNVPRLKIVFTLVEPAGLDTAIAASETEVEPGGRRELFSTEEYVHPLRARRVDLLKVVRQLSGGVSDGLDPTRSLVVTITE